MIKLFTKLLLILSILSVFSCDSDDTYDKKKAIDAFAKRKIIKIDPSLALYGVSLPRQQENSSWLVSASSKNSQNQNIKKEFNFSKNNKILLKKRNKYWHFYSGSKSSRYFFKPLIIDNTAYSLDSSGILRAINLKNSKKIFKKRLFPRKLLSTYQLPKISYDDNVIYAIAGSNRIVAFDLAKKEISWSKDLSSIPISTPLIAGQKLFILSNDNKIYAFDKNSAKLLWVQSAIFRPTAIFGAPDLVSNEDLLFASFSSGEIYAMKKDSGEVLWTNSLNISKAINSDFYLNDIDASPIIDKNIIYAAGNGGLIMAINIKNGEYLWKKEIATITNFWLANNYIYLINNDNKLIMIHKKLGKIKNIIQLPDYKKKKKLQSKFIYNGIVMSGSKLVISRFDGTIIIIDPINLKILKEIKIAKKLYHEPIIVNDKIYFYAIDNYIAKLVEVQ